MAAAWSPVGCRADVDLPGLAAGLKLVGQRDVVSKKAVPRHLDPNNASQHRPTVEADTHLKEINQSINLHTNTLYC